MNRQSETRQERYLKSLIIILFFAGVVFLLAPFVKRALLSYRIESVHIQQTQSVPTNEVSQGNVVIQPPSLSETLALYRHQPEVSIGQIIIPSVDIDVPIFPTLINENLLLGAVAMFPERTQNENRVFISHHLWNESLLFGPLMAVQQGEAIFMSYGNQVYHYEIMSIKTVEATDISVMDNREEGEITLITCDRPTLTSQRLVVKGVLKDGETEEGKQKMAVIQEGQKITSNSRLVMRNFGWLIVAVFIIIIVLTWVVMKL